MKHLLKYIKKNKLLSLFLLINLTSIVIIICIKLYSNQYCYKSILNLPTCKYAIVLGAGINFNKPSEYLRDRLVMAVKLYKANKIEKVLLSGDNSKKDYNEIDVMKKYCLEKGIKIQDIICDYAGFDTYSTMYRAYFKFNVKNAIIISQNYHLDRSIFISRHFGILSYGISADEGAYDNYRIYEAREQLAILKSFLDIILNRKPKYIN